MASPSTKSQKNYFFSILDFPMFDAECDSISYSSLYANFASDGKRPDTVAKFMTKLIVELSKTRKEHLIEAARELVSLQGGVSVSGNPSEEFILGPHFNLVRECCGQTSNWRGTLETPGLRTHLDAKTSTRPYFPVIPMRTNNKELFEFLLHCNDGPNPTPILIGNQALRFEEYAIHSPKYFYESKNAFMTLKADFEFLILGTCPVYRDEDSAFYNLNDAAQLFVMIHTINYQMRNYFGLSCGRYLKYDADTTERRVKLSVTWRKKGLSDYNIAKMLRSLGAAGVLVGSISDVATPDGKIIDGWPFQFEIEDLQKGASELQVARDATKRNIARLHANQPSKSDRPLTPSRSKFGARSGNKPNTPRGDRKRGDRKPAIESAPATQLKINSSRNWNAPIELPAPEEIMGQDELAELRTNNERLIRANSGLNGEIRGLEKIRTALEFRGGSGHDHYAYIERLIKADQDRSNDRSGSSDTITFEAVDLDDLTRGAEIADLKQQIHYLESTALHTNKSLAAKDIELLNLRTELGSSIVNSNESLAAKDSEIFDLKKELDRYDEEFNTKRLEVERLEAQVSELTKTVSDKDSEISELTKTVSDKDSEISELTQAIKDKDFEIESLNKAIAARDTEKAEIILTSGQAIAKKDVEVSELKQTISGLEQAISDLTEQVSKYAQIASDKDAEIADLKDVVDEHYETVDRLQKDLDDATHATTKAEAEKASERVRVLELEKELEEAKNEASEKSSDSEGISSDELEELKKTLFDGLETAFEKFRQARE